MMHRLLISMILGVALVNPAYSAGKAKPEIKGDAANGKSLSGECSGCHGPDGNAPSPNFPKLAGQYEKYLFTQLKMFRDGFRDPGPMMAGPVAGKTDQQLADLAAYFAGQTPSVGAAPDEKLRTLGERIYRGGNEAKGLSGSMMELADRILTIPYHDRTTRPESLNVATAAAILCAEFRRGHSK